VVLHTVTQYFHPTLPLHHPSLTPHTSSQYTPHTLLLQLPETGDHGPDAQQREHDEDVELAAVEERRHDGDSQDTRVRVVPPKQSILCVIGEPISYET